MVSPERQSDAGTESTPGLLLCLCAVVTGIVGGGIGVLFRAALSAIFDFHARGVEELHAYGVWGLLALIGICALCGAVAGWLTFQFAPEASGSGIPHVEKLLASGMRIRWAVLLPVKFVGGLFALGAGMSLGREGPTVQMAAAVAEATSQTFRLSEPLRRALIAAGAGAGLTAAFNAPIAGFLFVLEELRRPLTAVTYASGLIATIAADLVLRTALGSGSVLGIEDFPMPDLQALPLFALLGIVAGCGGVTFNALLLRSLDTFDCWRRGPRFLHTAFAGALAGAVGWWIPQATSGGEPVAERILRGDIQSADPALALGLLLGGKLLLTLTSYGSGAPGGLFAPLLVMGATLGALVGEVAKALPVSLPLPGVFALSGMVALFSASVRVPVTGIVLILEMTHSGHQLLPFAVSAAAAYLVASWLGGRPIYEQLVERDPQAKRGAQGRP